MEHEDRPLLDRAERYEQSPAGLLTFDVNGVVRDLNVAAAAMLELDRKHAVGVPLTALVTVDDQKRFLAHLRVVVASPDTSHSVELELKTRLGLARRWLMMSRRASGPQGEGAILVTLAEVTDRRRGDDAVRVLGELATTLLGTLDGETVLDHLATALVPSVADLCVIDVLGAKTLKRRAHASYADAVLGERFAEAEERWGLLPNVSFATLQALQTGRSQLLPPLTTDYLQAASAGDEHFTALVGHALRTWAVVPIVAGADRPLGAMRLATRGMRRQLDAQDLPFLEQVANLAARAWSTAKAHQEALSTAEEHGARRRTLTSELDDVARALQRARSALENRAPVAPKELSAAADRIRGLLAELRKSPAPHS